MAGRAYKDISGAHGAVAVSLASDTTLAAGCRALWIGVAGTVKVDCPSFGTAVSFLNVPVGVHPVQCTKVYSTANGTTATDIVALY